MKNIIKKYPLITFFVLAISFLWIIDIVTVGLLKQDDYTYVYIGAFGPALAAMLITSILNPGKVKPQKGKWLLVFIISLVIAGAVRWISRIWWNHDLSLSVLPGDALLVFITAFVIAGAFSQTKGIRAIISPLFNWRVSWKWYVFAIAFWPILNITGNLVASWLNVPVPAAHKLPDVPIYLAILVSFVWSCCFNGAQEEFGWRGFALPRLQQRFSPLIATIILGFFWGVFHWSGFFVGYRGASPMQFIMRLGDIAIAIPFTWLYNRIGGKSLLPLFLLHASVNATIDFIPRANLTVYTLLGVAGIIMVFTDKMWKRLPENKNICENQQDSICSSL